jgi:basic amino acid/polyamine antiporter, APA family
VFVDCTQNPKHGAIDQQPARTIPRALAMAMLIVTLAYVAVRVIAQGLLSSLLAHSTVPLADPMARVGPALWALM